jgi:pectinesterase
MDAVAAAPDYSMHRHIIYIKKGVYNEYVDIKKKKWNLMMVGEGMNATIITGNRNFIDGWTTFRSATFGKLELSILVVCFFVYGKDGFDVDFICVR